MKRLFFYLLLLVAPFSTLKAQINVNINLGSQPQWGPSGYNYVDYYYLPDIETYYYVPKRQFIYQENGQWIFANALPGRHQGYNLYNGYKVVINRPTPYLHFKEDRIKYAGFKNKKGAQITIKQKRAKNPVVVSTRANNNAKIKNTGNSALKLNGNAGRGHGNHGDEHGNKGGKGNGNNGGGHGKGKH